MITTFSEIVKLLKLIELLPQRGNAIFLPFDQPATLNCAKIEFTERELVADAGVGDPHSRKP